MRDAHRSAGMITQDQETAKWLTGNKNLRVVDTLYKVYSTDPEWRGQDVTVGDASRIGLLNPGGRYLKPGTAGDRLVETKQIDYREKLRK